MLIKCWLVWRLLKVEVASSRQRTPVNKPRSKAVGEPEEKDLQVAITGVVIPTEWSEDHQVSGIAVAGWDETEYPIWNDDMGKELRKRLHDHVKIEGQVGTDDQGRSRLHVRSFQVVPMSSSVRKKETNR
jgi:hypothetical protein